VGMGEGNGEEHPMKLHLLFLLLDLVTLLVYPVLFILNRVRRLLGYRR
jgi:hypothetical protein